MEKVDYNKPFAIKEGVEFVFTDVGHIIGTKAQFLPGYIFGFDRDQRF